MNIYVYEIEGIAPTQCVGVLDTYTSFNFTKKFQGCGSWTLRGNYTQEARKFLKTGNLVYVNPQVCGLIHTVDFETDSEGNTTYTAYGYELCGILGYRIVWNTYNHNLPAADWVNGLVQENTTGERALFTTFLKPSISCPNLDKQVSYSNLLDSVSAACAAVRTTGGMLLGFDITCDVSRGFSFSLLEGEDRTYESDEPVLISRDMNNVSSLSYAESCKETADVVLCGGEGEGSGRKFSKAGDFTKSGLARRELFNDSRDLQSTYTDSSGNQKEMSESDYLKLLTQEAESSLKADSITVDAEATVTSSEALALLGAKVTLIDRAFGVRTDDYVTEVNWIDEADGQLTTITIGEGVEASA